jgi:AraC-like DNA-binding protein
MNRPSEIAYFKISPQPAEGVRRGFDLLHPQGLTTAVPATGPYHRHDFQEIILVESGRGVHSVDGQPGDLLPGTAALIGQGRVHLMLHTDELTAWIVRFTADFLPRAEGELEGELLTRLFNPLGPGQTVPIPEGEREELHQILRLIELDFTRPQPVRSDLTIRHLLTVLLLRLDRLATEQPGDERLSLPEYRTYQDFLLVLEEHFRSEHRVAFYAEALYLSPDRLSRSLAQAVGKTAKQLIAERIVLEARRLLTYTTLSMKEIADALGFRDQFHFSKAFKGQTGLPPQAFREQWLKAT